MFWTKADAETGVNVPVHLTPPPDVADAVETVISVVGEDLVVAVVEEDFIVVAVVETLVLTAVDEGFVLDATLVAVPGTHWW